MGLAELIEQRRFVGREFLVWLWFESELFEGRFSLDALGACELWLEGQITLVQEKEQSRLKGAAPSSAPEAHEALRQGKLPSQARVRVTRGELEYAFLFNADAFALSGVKIPSVVKDAADEQFYERMYLIEELETLFTALYGEFLALRLSTSWEPAVAPFLRAWVRGEPVDVAAYQKLKARLAPVRGAARSRTTPPPAEAPQRAARGVA
ncbi:hypothetical protein WME76_34370 [Sorangium sp. So ce119]|uniref:hypothetical protein n=1 Tax=Sorangium sp. So ce119 TaxID=3133279 RepID=UPI003F624CD1